jgi:hypothetical protein
MFNLLYLLSRGLSHKLPQLVLLCWRQSSSGSVEQLGTRLCHSGEDIVNAKVNLMRREKLGVDNHCENAKDLWQVTEVLTPNNIVIPVCDNELVRGLNDLKKLQQYNKVRTSQ